jgi:2,3-bisphosphoglycerate-dependent phosphoglycerate mutase
MNSQLPPLPPLLFVRHGATALNAAGLRCGGDVDLPLLDLGHRQASAAAHELVQRRARVDVIVTSSLQRTRQTAAIIARHLRCLELVIEPGFDERRLGDWNRRPIAETQAELAAGVTPPGGESNAEFTRRVREAARVTLLPRLPRHVLLVGSKGVARVLRELAGEAPRCPVGNAEIVEFDLAALATSVSRRALECAA